MAGKTSLENCELEGIVDAIADGWTALILAMFYQKNNELKVRKVSHTLHKLKVYFSHHTPQEEKCKEVYEKTLPNLFTQVNAMIEKNGRPEGWVWGDKVHFTSIRWTLLS